MAIKSISELESYSLFIFDLDNTLYNEEDYLFQAYYSICERFEATAPGHDRNSLLNMIMNIYREEGREKLFNKFLMRAGIEELYLAECLKILRHFIPGTKIALNANAGRLLKSLIDNGKRIFVLTNGHPDQQKNKIRNIIWNGLEENIRFIYANEIEPKPSPAGVQYILRITCTGAGNTVFIGDADVDRACAGNSGIDYIDIRELSDLSV